ncbi:Uu.00g013570.m01.CDS01 [Anthostomella pinea]|uniref:Uu.00g013570.m01.CDS01 n=1 Tax=Anthostomella pinea TaxID=933095 RepID=A0AAI8VY57_9PEZI|nr:Uu.00g013570.m01.CDS01 [Anthostomella pinea]
MGDNFSIVPIDCFTMRYNSSAKRVTINRNIRGGRLYCHYDGKNIGLGNKCVSRCPVENIQATLDHFFFNHPQDKRAFMIAQLRFYDVAMPGYKSTKNLEHALVDALEGQLNPSPQIVALEKQLKEKWTKEYGSQPTAGQGSNEEQTAHGHATADHQETVDPKGPYLVQQKEIEHPSGDNTEDKHLGDLERPDDIR